MGSAPFVIPYVLALFGTVGGPMPAISADPLSAAMLTLVVLPVMYDLFFRAQGFRKRTRAFFAGRPRKIV